MSLPRYPEYKNSGVAWLGVVPGHWSVKRFKQVFREREERSEEGEETLLSVSAYTGVSPRSEIVEDGDRLSRADSLEGYKVCYPNDLVMNIMLAWNRGLAFSDYKGIVSPAYCVFRVIDGSDPRFLNYLVRTDLYTLYFKAYSSGVIDSRLRLYPDVFGGLSCVLPILREQQTIAAFLDSETGKIDALIAEQQRLVALLAEKRQVVISHAVTKGLNPNAPMKDSGIEWLGNVPTHWMVAVAKRISSIFVPQRNKPDLNEDGDGLCWVTMEQMRSETIANTDLWVSESAAHDAGTRALTAGAVIASCVGTFGLAAINKSDVIINQQLQAFIPTDRIDAKFLRYFVVISGGYFEQIGTAATIAYVNQIGFANMPLAVPPMDEQRAIVAYLETESTKFDILTDEANRAIELLQERRSALITAAVTGKIDVRSYFPKLETA